MEEQPPDSHCRQAVGKRHGRNFGQCGDALRELGLMMDNGGVPYMILGQLAWFVRTKVPAPKVTSAVEAVFRTDLAIKTSAGDPRALLERLVVELCGR